MLALCHANFMLTFMLFFFNNLAQSTAVAEVQLLDLP